MAPSDTNLQDDETKAALARAFDTAWDDFIALEGEDAATDANRRRLATQIVTLARSGETDEEKLGRGGLIYLRVLAEAARIGARGRDVSIVGPAEPPPDHAVQAYAPETIAAMSTALELCLDELPLQIPGEALRSLSASILDDAAHGERDPERLRRHALEMLRLRQ